MKLRNFMSFAFISNAAISIIFIACITLTLTLDPEFAASLLNFGGYGITALVLISATPTKIMGKRDLLTNKAWYRIITAAVFSVFSSGLAVIALQLSLLSFGYEYQYPTDRGTPSVYATNVIWCFFMVAIIELCLKFTEAMFIKSEAK